METLSQLEARRLALARAGLLKPEWTGFPWRGAGSGKRARAAAHRVIRRFGYLQLDTVSVAGARSHVIVLLSRLTGFDAQLGEALLQPSEPLFEYWGHEASWLPIELYPVFSFRRIEFSHHPWWGDLVGQHPKIARGIMRRIRDEGPLRSLDLEGRGSRGWWDLKVAKKVASALWSSGALVIRERRNFQRFYDLPERVIPQEYLETSIPRVEAIEVLLLQALEGHGWASTTTLIQTWRFKKCRSEVAKALRNLHERGQILECALDLGHKSRVPGWVRPADLELAGRLQRVRPRRDRGVLLSPFDPVLWDRARTLQLFSFHQVLEIFKPAAQRIYGYYCLPVLAGDRLVARFDLKAHRKRGVLEVLAAHFEGATGSSGSSRLDGETREAHRAAQTGLDRFAESLELKLVGRPGLTPA
ncbi:MAG: crosslink repair DNA glycosylase YcaQ family protein [Thermoanaerobaculia bacterium]